MNKHHNHRRKGVVLPFKRPAPTCSPCQAAAQARTGSMRRGRIDLPEEREDEQPTPPCTTFTLHRGDSVDLDGNVLIAGGFYVMIGCEDGSMDCIGPFATLEQAERLAARIAEERGYHFIPDNGIIAQVEREYE